MRTLEKSDELKFLLKHFFREVKGKELKKYFPELSKKLIGKKVLMLKNKF